MQPVVEFDLMQDLNPQQCAAVLAPDGPTLVLAGAGSGKTRVLTTRIAHLIARAEHAVSPWRILAVTFTNKAAAEMRARVERQLGQTARDLWMGTFHAICARLLRAYGADIGIDPHFVIFDDDDRVALVTRILKDQQVPERFFAPRVVATHLDRAKNRAQGPEDYDSGDLFGEVVSRCYAEYQKRLAESRALDFGDLLLLGLRLATHPDAAAKVHGKFEHVLVDEYQDTNRVQYLLARALAQRGSLYAVGDPDQSIYAFRGADLRNVLDFEQDFPGATLFRLEQNYRSTPSILRLAEAVIDHNFDRKPKTLWTKNADGPRPVLRETTDERSEAAWIVHTLGALRKEGYRAGNIAVFYRTHAQSRVIEEALRLANQAYIIVGGMRFYERAEIKDAIAYLRVLQNPHDTVDLLRIVNVPTRGIGDTTIGRVIDLARTQGVPLWEAMVRATRADCDVLKPTLRKKLADFVVLIEELRAQPTGGLPSKVLESVLTRSGYLERLAIEGTPEAQSRLENLQELIVSMRDYETTADNPLIEGFLERVTLQGDIDNYQEDDGTVSLMSIHSAKGLEFPVVFIAGLEENLFPHARSTSSADLEEERRLFYVAITRARERLFLSFAQSRRLYAQPNLCEPSRFLAEIPRDGVTVEAGLSPRSREARGEPWIDRSESQAAPRREGPYVGKHVRHAKFGMGIVIASVGEGKEAKLTINFPQVGRKTVLAAFVEDG